MSMSSDDSFKSVLDLQNDIVEAQRHIIGELMRLYSTDPEFELPENLQKEIREVNQLYHDLNTP